MTTANPGLSEEFVSPFGCFAPSTLVATESLRLARPPASTPDHQRVPRSDVDAFRFFLSREIECPSFEWSAKQHQHQYQLQLHRQLHRQSCRRLRTTHPVLPHSRPQTSRSHRVLQTQISYPVMDPPRPTISPIENHANSSAPNATNTPISCALNSFQPPSFPFSTPSSAALVLIPPGI